MAAAASISVARDRALDTFIDRAEIAQVVQDWGLFRDTGEWDRLRALYAPHATMQTTWFVCTAADFVDRSIEAAKQGARAQHFIGAASIELNGDRAIAETRMVLLVRGPLDGVEVDVRCYGWFYDRFVRHDGRCASGSGCRSTRKTGSILLTRRAARGSSRERSRSIRTATGTGRACRRGGARITPGLPTPDSPALASLYAEGATWLEQR